MAAQIYKSVAPGLNTARRVLPYLIATRSFVLIDAGLFSADAGAVLVGTAVPAVQTAQIQLLGPGRQYLC